MAKVEEIQFTYKFRMKDGVEKEFRVRLSTPGLEHVCDGSASLPEWAKLSCCKCPNCPLSESLHEYCPAAASISELVDFFKATLSYEIAEVIVSTAEREYRKTVPVQKGLSGIVGLLMATSGCPILAKLRPMARFHLPFSSVEETQYRILSMYLLSQFFLLKKGKKADWTLKGLQEFYEQVRIVNKHFCKRLSSITIEDASANALVVLNTFADAISFALDKELLHKTEALFSPCQG